MISQNKKIIALFELVRDIPYGNINSRNPFQVLKKNKGTCSGKHLLLAHFYKMIKVPVRFVMGKSSFNYINDYLPNSLKKNLKSEIHDFHNYLQIFNKKWITVDATFDSILQKYGFPVNVNWDGKSNCIVAFESQEEIIVKDLIKEKEKALLSLSENENLLRKQFIDALSVWLDSIRSKDLH